MSNLKSIFTMTVLFLLISCAGTPEGSIDGTAVKENRDIDVPETSELPDPPIIIDSSLPSKTPVMDENINDNQMDVPEIIENSETDEKTQQPATPVSKPVISEESKPTPQRTVKPTLSPTLAPTQKPLNPSPSPAPRQHTSQQEKTNRIDKNRNNDAIVERREVYALPGDDILITFNHEGWIFLGYQKPGDDQGVHFVNRESRSGETLFTFQAITLGSFQLDFSYQDNFNSLFQKQEVIVHVINENAWEEQPDQDIFSDYSFRDAEDFFNQGNYTSAMEIIESLDESPEGNELAARIKERQSQPEQALSYWEKNLSAPAPYNTRASESIARLKMDQGDLNDLFQNWNSYVPDNAALSQQTVLDLLKNIDNSDYDLDSIEPLLNMVNNPLLRLDQPEIYYLLGRIHEKEGPLRNFQRAKEYYQLLIQLYPTHKLSDTSRARINYINRYFILFQ